MSTEQNTSDPMIGLTVELQSGERVTITERVKDHYKVTMADGGWRWLLASAVKAPAAGRTGDTPRTAGEIIAAFHAKPMSEREAIARAAVVDLQAMRAGLRPGELTAADRQNILARLAKDRQPVDAETHRIVQRRLAAAKEAESAKPSSHQQSIESNVTRLLKAGSRGE